MKPKTLFLLLAMAIAPAAAQEMHVENDVAVKMRDGVVLRADVWRPAAEGKFPVLVYRTPYNRRGAPESYTTFRKAVERGYAVVIQDVRGRYGSEGEFEPYRHEGRDGYDTIEWAAAQSWSNGNVGTFGLSYPGAVQWLAAVESPPHLKAMVPAMTFSTPSNFIYSGGVFDLSWPAWIWNNIAPDTRARKNLDGPKTGAEARRIWRERGREIAMTLPLGEMKELKDVAPYFFEWLRHPPGDAWWDWCELRHKYGRTSAAVLNLSGWYDEAYGPEGALTNFNGLRAARRGQPDARAKVVIGPWVHGVDATGRTRAGDREFGEAAAMDYDELVLGWMDCHLRGIKHAACSGKPVRLFVMGANRWREADAWPLPETKFTPLYLACGEKGAGKLEWNAPAGADCVSVFVSDPANPIVDPHPLYSGAHDYRDLAKREDVLIFDSAPMEEDTEITGPVTAEIFLSTDAPDTDLWVRLMDVAPDGAAFNLMSPGLEVIRASYRNGGPERELLKPSDVYKLRLTNILTGNLFRKGHRIRVQISTSFLPHFSRNLHTGALETVSAQMRKAAIRIHHGPEHPSRLLLPLIPQ